MEIKYITEINCSCLHFLNIWLLGHLKPHTCFILYFYWGSAQNSENANQQHMLRNLRHIILSYHIATFVFSVKEMYCIPELGMK